MRGRLVLSGMGNSIATNGGVCCALVAVFGVPGSDRRGRQEQSTMRITQVSPTTRKGELHDHTRRHPAHPRHCVGRLDSLRGRRNPVGPGSYLLATGRHGPRGRRAAALLLTKTVM